MSLIQLPPVKLSPAPKDLTPSRFSVLKKQYQRDVERFMKKPVEYLDKQKLINNPPNQ